jgi:myo-inositol-1(or 4)-monophosphatase
MKNYKNFAIELAQKAGGIMRENFSLGMKKKWKSDGSPVTITDTIVNKLVIDSVEKTFPDHGIIGEEESNNLKGSEYVWVCDPLDGTVPFSHACPTFVFSLALVKNGVSVLGVIYDPIMSRMLFAEKDKGAFLNSERTKVSDQKILNSKSIVNYDADVRGDNIRKNLLKKKCYVPNLYSAAYASLLVACGQFTAELYGRQYPWDGAATKVIVEEAGGRVTDFSGKEQKYNRDINGFIASNGLVHDELVEICKRN